MWEQVVRRRRRPGTGCRASLRSTLPVFKNPANKHRAVSLTAKQFRYSFGDAVSQEESDELYARWHRQHSRTTTLTALRA